MSRKSRENKAKSIESIDTTTAIAQIATPVRVDSGKYVDMLAPEQKTELLSLLARKGIHARAMGLSVGDQKTAQDCDCALVIAVESAYRKIDKGESPVSVKAHLMSIIAEQSGYLGKYIPENSLFQGLNRLGGNASETSVSKAGIDRWARTPRTDGKRVLINSDRLDRAQGFVFLLPELWETGYYVRPTPEQLKNACNHAIRKELSR